MAMLGFPWWGWVIVAGVLGLAELHLPGSYLIWIALGAALTAGADAAFGLSLEGQIGTFALASALSCAGGYFVYRGFSGRQRSEMPLNERSRSMLGTRGVVCEGFASGHGKVRLGDGVWLASGPELAEGTPVVVTAVQGTRLVVEPLKAAG
jgi:membrane protein implicated in regulation of membrane protease activity